MHNYLSAHKQYRTLQNQSEIQARKQGWQSELSFNFMSGEKDKEGSVVG